MLKQEADWPRRKKYRLRDHLLVKVSVNRFVSSRAKTIRNEVKPETRTRGG
jgi:hypothetical protein